MTKWRRVDLIYDLIVTDSLSISEATIELRLRTGRRAPASLRPRASRSAAAPLAFGPRAFCI